jgi:hypothetical protein
MAATKKHKNGVLAMKDGWHYLSIFGKPYDRGFSHGYLMAPQLTKIKEMLRYFSEEDNGYSWEWFVEHATKVFKPYMEEHDEEFLEEMKGIAEGATANGSPWTQDEILTWNSFFSLYDYWFPNHISETTDKKHYKYDNPHSYRKDRCSAFLAVGSYTKNGQIVLAHNTFDNFLSAQYCSVMLNIRPEKGNKILMQTCPGWIWSGTDFFITSAGIMGAETTIGGFTEFKQGNPIFCRERDAMQYGKTLDDYVKIFLKDNTGGYANSWLFGDTNTNEIMRIELGLKYHRIERKKDGYFIGFNAAYDPKIRNLECHDAGAFYDIRRHQGARRKRLTELMEEHKGKITEAVAKKILADHYDVYLRKINPCSRTVDSHYEMDAREYMSQGNRPKPFQPRGALDGKTTSSALTKKMQLWARWGNSSGMPFIASRFFEEHSEWAFLKPYLIDRPSQPWSMFKSL